jgi:hypothetical protein
VAEGSRASDAPRLVLFVHSVQLGVEPRHVVLLLVLAAAGGRRRLLLLLRHDVRVVVHSAHLQHITQTVQHTSVRRVHSLCSVKSALTAQWEGVHGV